MLNALILPVVVKECDTKFVRMFPVETSKENMREDAENAASLRIGKKLRFPAPSCENE